MTSKPAEHPVTACAAMMIELKNNGWDVHLLADLIAGPRVARDAEELAIISGLYAPLLPQHAKKPSGTVSTGRNALDKER